MSFSASVNCKTRSSSQISSKVQRDRPAMRLQICVSDKPISSPSSLPVRINARPIAPRTARSRSFRRRVNCCGFSILPFPFSRATISTDTISCGEICPTRPARCCNIGRGIFFALQIGSQRNVATPLHHFAELFLCISMRVSSIALPSNAVQFTSLLFRCFSGPCYSLPMLCYASHCEAIPLLIKGIPCHSTSEPVEATPLLITAILRHHISSQDLSPHCRCSSTLFPAKPFRCFPGLILAVQGRARRVHATPLRYSISSQRNRPFPLLRHWPMPENLP